MRAEERRKLRELAMQGLTILRAAVPDALGALEAAEKRAEAAERANEAVFSALRDENRAHAATHARAEAAEAEVQRLSEPPA